MSELRSQMHQLWKLLTTTATTKQVLEISKRHLIESSAKLLQSLKHPA